MRAERIWPSRARAAATAAAVLALGFAAAACGGGATTDAPAPTPAAPATTSSTEAASATPGPGARLALVQDQSVLVEEGGVRREIVHLPDVSTQARYPAWSPDGRRIAFVQSSLLIQFSGDWGDDIYVVDADGSNLELLRRHTVTGTQVQGLAWTADGSALLIGVRQTDIENEMVTGFELRVERHDIASGVTTTIVRNAISPTVARAADRLAFVRVDRGRASLWVADLDGSGVRQIDVEGRSILFEPRLSPDGTSVVFSSESPALAATPSRQGPIERVSEALGIRRAEAHGIPMEVFLVDLDTDEIRVLTNLSLDDPVSDWSADGATLYTIATSALYSMRADGSEIQTVGDGIFSGQIDVY